MSSKNQNPAADVPKQVKPKRFNVFDGRELVLNTAKRPDAVAKIFELQNLRKPHIILEDTQEAKLTDYKIGRYEKNYRVSGRKPALATQAD